MNRRVTSASGAGARGVDAQSALAAELHDLRQRERRLGRVEAARAAAAESVLHFRLQLERRLQSGDVGLRASRRQSRLVDAQVGVASESLFDRMRERQRLARGRAG
jgi:hypothetical protein